MCPYPASLCSMKTVSLCSLHYILLSYAKCESQRQSYREPVGVCVCEAVHLVSVTVIYNVQRCSTPCAGLLSLLAALSPQPAVLTGEMDVSLWCRLNKSLFSRSIFISAQCAHLITNPACLTVGSLKLREMCLFLSWDIIFFSSWRRPPSLRILF